jgi:hypothetical protein
VLWPVVLQKRGWMLDRLEGWPNTASCSVKVAALRTGHQGQLILEMIR